MKKEIVVFSLCLLCLVLCVLGVDWIGIWDLCGEI